MEGANGRRATELFSLGIERWTREDQLSVTYMYPEAQLPTYDRVWRQSKARHAMRPVGIVGHANGGVWQMAGEWERRLRLRFTRRARTDA